MKSIIPAVGTEAFNNPALRQELKRKLISYANCNRCELTPQDAREILLLLDTIPNWITVVHGR